MLAAPKHREVDIYDTGTTFSVVLISFEVSTAVGSSTQASAIFENT